MKMSEAIKKYNLVKYIDCKNNLNSDGIYSQDKKAIEKDGEICVYIDSLEIKEPCECNSEKDFEFILVIEKYSEKMNKWNTLTQKIENDCLKLNKKDIFQMYAYESLFFWLEDRDFDIIKYLKDNIDYWYENNIDVDDLSEKLYRDMCKRQLNIIN